MTTDPAAVACSPRADGSAEPPPGGLTRREHEMLAFERQWWRRPGAKEAAIRDLFGVSPTRYYQVLNSLVDRPDALASDPVLVRRLRRVRAGRHRGRLPEVLGRGADTV